MTLYGILEAEGPADPRYAVHKIEAGSERDALAEYAISRGYADPRNFEPTAENPDGYLNEVPPHGQTVMTFENTELIAVPVLPDGDLTHLGDDELADFHDAYRDDDEARTFAENEIAARLKLSPDETEQGFTPAAAEAVDRFVRENRTSERRANAARLNAMQQGSVPRDIND